MKKIIIYILFVFAANMAAAQCYQPNVDKGNAALANGKYTEAYDFYSKATKCPDASRFNNGQEAREGIKKCLPVLTIEGKQVFEMTVGPEEGERTFNVQSKRIRMWIIDGSHRRQNIIIDPKQITNNQFHAQWEANLNNTPRDLNIRLFSVDGVKEIDAYITIHQAAGGLRINGGTDKEYLSSWEGNAIRFDITGIPAREQYQLIGIDTSWITIQKHSRHFFALIKPNKTTNSRSNRITISSNNQNLTITIRQKGSLGTNNSKSMARVPTNGLRVSPSATIPIVVRSKTRHTDLNSSQNTNTYIKGFLNAQGEVIALGSNLVLYNRYCENYPLRQSGIYPINNNCFLQVTLDTSYKQKIGISEYTNNYYSATLYSYNDKKLNKLGLYKFHTGYKQKDICIHRFNNDDFSIWIQLETEKTLYKNDNDLTFRDVNFQCELYRFDGHLYFKDYSYFNPTIYEDGIVLIDKWTNYLKKKDKEWYEDYLIRRNGKRVILPKDVSIHSIKDGVIRFSKESKHTSEGVHLREYGFCDLNGKIFIKPQYFFANDFSEGYTIVKIPQKFGYCHIDKYGNVINAGKYAWKMKPFSDGLAMVYGGDYPYCPSFINKNGKIQLSLDSFMFPEEYKYPYLYYDSYKLYNYHKGVAWALKKGNPKYCLINKNGETIIDSLFDDVTIMHSGLAGIYIKNNNRFGGLWGIINNKGNIIVSPRCANPPQFSPDGSVRLIGECLLTIDSLGNVFDGANVNGIEVTPTSDSLFIFSVNGIFGFFNNILGIINIPPQFNNVLPFSENIAAVQVGSKWGFIDRTGKQIIPTVFDKIKPFHNGFAEVVIEGKTYSIDKNGIIQ